MKTLILILLCALLAVACDDYDPDGEGIGIDVQAKTRQATIAYSQLYTRTAMEISCSLQRLSAKKKGKRIGIELEVGTLEHVPPKDKQN